MPIWWKFWSKCRLEVQSQWQIRQMTVKKNREVIENLKTGDEEEQDNRSVYTESPLGQSL